MELFVYSRCAIEAVRPHDVPHVVISITSGSDDVARLPATNWCKAILRLVFADAEQPSEQYPTERLFSEAHARQIWQFLAEHRSSVGRVLIHCDAGRSRSPAVAAAIALMTTGSADAFLGGLYRPNQRVYQMLVGSYSVESMNGSSIKPSS